jgi:hypothetical protein
VCDVVEDAVKTPASPAEAGPAAPGPAEPSPPAPAAQPSPSKLPRWSLAVLSLIHALVLGWGALVLPWKILTAFSIITVVLAALYLATAVLAALRQRFLALVWRITAAGALAWFAYVSWGVLSSAFYIRSIYAGLGQDVAAVLMAIVGLVALISVPYGLWGVGATGGIRGRKAALLALAVIVGAGSTRLLLLRSEAHGAAVASEEQARAFEVAVAGAVDMAELPATKAKKSLMHTAAAVCQGPPAREGLTLVATFLAGRPGRESVTTRCFGAPDPVALAGELARVLAADAVRGPVKLDLVTKSFVLPDRAGAPFVEGLVFRPGLDGACSESGACLMPWQLVVLDAFSSYAPIASVPDARLGVSVDSLQTWLGAAAATRIETKSWLLAANGSLTALGRTHDPTADVTPESVAAAAAKAAQYITASQQKDGRFKYIVDPFTGKVETGDFSIARQAGTTLVVCELSPESGKVTLVAQRSLALIARHERRFTLADGSDGSILRFPLNAPFGEDRIGGAGLGLSALLRCRDRVGPENDALIGRLARTILSLQRDNGSFGHGIDTTTGARLPDKPGGIFVDGQLVLALGLLEAIAGEEEGEWPSKARLHDAVERAMTHFGERYWDTFVEPFLFIEENWHCIAAAAMLGHHRNDAYERFCIDYVTFKARVLHGPESGMHADFIGGYGFGNVVPPHNTATSGYGEALAAALKIKRARGMDIGEDSERMRAVMRFLLRNQWTKASCYACAPKANVIGGFSEHMASPMIRIDFVQHAWAALGHGALALDLPGDSS